MANRRLAFAAAVRVVIRVHDRTADRRADAHVALAAGLAKVDVLMVDVADLADDCGAVHADEADFAGRETNLSQVAVLRHELSGRTGGADKLCAAAGVQLDVVDDRTNGDVGQRQAVARLDVGGGGGDDGVASLQAVGCQHVAKLAVFILDEGDERAAVGVILEALHDSGHIQLVAAEIDDSVLALAAAAAMADGDAAVAVAAGTLLERLKKAALGLCLFIYAVEGGNSHVSSRRGVGLKRFDRHCALHSFKN